MTSGEPIRVGGEGLGPLASGGVTSVPLGWASVSGARRPDLFVAADKWYPGVYLYRWLEDGEGGVPVFDLPDRVGMPFPESRQASGTVIQGRDGGVHGFWIDGNEIIRTTYDPAARSFREEGRIALKGLPRPPESLAVLPRHQAGSADGFNLLLGVTCGPPYRPTNPGHRHAEYRPFDGAGHWRGGLPRVGMYAAHVPDLGTTSAQARLVSATPGETHGGYYSIGEIRLGASPPAVITGSRFGNLYTYSLAGGPLDALAGGSVARNAVVGADGVILRHPACRPSPIGYPDPQTGDSGLIVGGECCLYYYRSRCRRTEGGDPVFESPRPVLQRNAELYAGSLPVPTVVDWDGDGVPDIVAGNSEGRVLFFRNIGTGADPSFAPGVPISAGGREIHVQPGYGENIQGPGEARWGYTCPTVVDWNGNGLPDIVMSDSTGRHRVFMNRGTAARPALEAGHPLYLDGLEIHGSWRVKPAAAELDGRMAYVILDEEDEFHLYWRIDDYNLEEGLKLRLEDGSPIRGNFLEAGGTGRLKLNLCDWDGDGLVDMIVGTPRHGSVPDPVRGLPQSLGLPGSAILFLKNTGSNREPVFQFPELMTHDGEPIFLGQHACGPTPAAFTGAGRPDLVSGRENGRLYFYSRDCLGPT